MRQRKGITIVEMVIYLGIVSALLVIFINLFGVIVDRQLETESLSSTQYESTYLLSRFTYDFGRASSIDVPAFPGSSSAMLRLIIDGIAHEYTASDGAFVLLRDGQILRMTSNKSIINSPQFIRYGTGTVHDIVQLDFDIESHSQLRGIGDSIHFSTQLGIRDK